MVLRNVDMVVAQSEESKRLASKWLGKTVYVPHAIEMMPMTPQKFNTARLKILYVGRLAHYKGVDVLLNAMPAIVARHTKTQLYIVGEGDMRTMIEKRIVELNLSNYVTVHGWANDSKLAEYYSWANIVVIPSVVPEAFCRVGVEACSAGRPVIGARIGGIPGWLKDGKNGHLFQPGNSRDLSQKILSLAEDEEALLRMSAYARKVAERFSIQSHVNQLDGLYEELA
jgi:glycosyltransferase involved in cell wall biosynthesis